MSSGRASRRRRGGANPDQDDGIARDAQNVRAGSGGSSIDVAARSVVAQNLRAVRRTRRSEVVCRHARLWRAGVATAMAGGEGATQSTRVNVETQFTSQVRPSSAEKACSKRKVSRVTSEKTKRTQIGRPSSVS